MHVKVRNFMSVNSAAPMFRFTEGATVDAENVVQVLNEACSRAGKGHQAAKASP
jgi:hypothetical protein